MGSGVAIDSNGDILITGYFDSDSLTFGSVVLTNTITSWDNDNLFITKYNSAGAVIWSKNNKGKTNAAGIGTDNYGNSYLVGRYRDSVYFGNSKLKNPFGYGDIFVARYDVSGNAIWGKDITIVSVKPGNVYIYPRSIASKVTNNIYFGGEFDCKKMILDTCQLTNSDTSGNQTAMLLAKLYSNDVGIDELPGSRSYISIFPNPNNGSFIIDMNDDVKSADIIIFNQLGQKIHSQNISKGKNSVDMSKISSGLYHFSILSNGVQINSGKLLIE